MQTVVIDLPAELAPPRKRWTRTEYEQLAASGALDGQHLELVGGELINKMGKKRPHSNSLALLHEWLLAVIGPRRIQVETPIDVAPEDNPSSEPEPDLILLKRDYTHIAKANPCPEDILLIAEVSDTTLGFDLTTKAALYARASIPEYWVLDVNGRRMIVHRDPQGGRFRSVIAFTSDERISPLAAPNASLLIADVIAE